MDLTVDFQSNRAQSPGLNFLLTVDPRGPVGNTLGLNFSAESRGAGSIPMLLLSLCVSLSRCENFQQIFCMFLHSAMGLRGRVVSTPGSIPLQRVGERVQFLTLPVVCLSLAL